MNIHNSTNDTKEPLWLYLCADGSKLPLMLIFKGTQNGQIAKKEFPNISPGCKYYCQENEWMDERAIVEWVQNILKPFIETAPENAVPLLFLYSYQCHMMKSVLEAIQQLGVEGEHIPGGCTSHCLPIDVEINKTLKVLVCKDWENWMFYSGINVFSHVLDEMLRNKANLTPIITISHPINCKCSLFLSCIPNL